MLCHWLSGELFFLKVGQVMNVVFVIMFCSEYCQLTLFGFFTCCWAGLSWQRVMVSSSVLSSWPCAFYPWPFPKVCYPAHSNYKSQVGQSSLDFLLCRVYRWLSTLQLTLCVLRQYFCIGFLCVYIWIFSILVTPICIYYLVYQTMKPAYTEE